MRVEDEDRRDVELTLREAELVRREARLSRETRERERTLGEREQQLHQRERALATVATELAAERERLRTLQAQLLEDIRRLERRRLQASPRWFAAPEADEHPADDDWWAKVLGREAPAA